MVVGAFPVAKLGALIIKQVSKPLANAVKRRAKNSPFFRTYICMPPAQFYHWAEVKMKMWSMNLGKPLAIPKLNEAMAIDLGAELLGEGLIFVIAAGILIAEYIRSSRKEEKKEEERIAQLTQIEKDLKDLYLETAKQDAQIRELIRILHVKLPDVNYVPRPYDKSLIPIHHQEGYEAAHGSPSMFSYVKGWVMNGIDLLLPEVEDAGHPSMKPESQWRNKEEDAGVVALKVVPSSTTTQNSNNSNNGGIAPSSSSTILVSGSSQPNRDKGR